MGPDVAKVLFNHLEGCHSVNFPLVSGPRTQEPLRSIYEFVRILVCVNFPKAGGLCDPT